MQYMRYLWLYFRPWENDVDIDLRQSEDVPHPKADIQEILEKKHLKKLFTFCELNPKLDLAGEILKALLKGN